MEMEMDIMDIMVTQESLFRGALLRGDTDVAFQESNPNVASSTFKD